VTTQIVLADDHQMMREGLAALLEADSSLEVVATADNGRDAVRLAAELRPDIVVMDIGMPELNGIEATRQIVERCPGTKVVGLSVHKDRRFVAQMLKAGASAYVLKESSVGELVTAVHAVIAGSAYLSPGCTRVVVEDYVNCLDDKNRPAERRASALTPREREVLQLMAEGCSTKQTAARLGVSAKTVETHRRQMMERLDTFSVAGLVKYALREGLTSLDQ
jgi:two-component system, NarL family, response regulator NreC